MMICKADFEELFPHLFQPDPAPAPAPAPALAPASRRMARSASVECLARWENEGGTVQPATGQPRTAAGRRPQYGSDMSALARMPALARASAMAATMPGAASYSAALSMLSAYGQMTRDRHETL
ncbi:hypothetical protein [Maliponia aquimaris]|uniref:Uncharacterized protein n=1 Tax=Maliponia aquimaris TaxID=1673631 RepID=A0A238L120_9RHOB|nr:hypothetical protein [Maliponia aquimaris]SMX48783.1 hypothetical protein MAA8898_04092 [Maliponia aquimaris]